MPLPRSIFGQHTLFEADIPVLATGKLPTGWQRAQSSVNAFVAFRSSAPKVFYKEFWPRNRLERLKRLIRGSRCDRARDMSIIMPQQGFNTPAVLCWGQVDTHREFMITEAVTGTGIASYLETLRGKSSLADRRHKWALFTALGSEIGRLHHAGFVHGDLRPNNMLVDTSDGFTFHYIDNERTRQHKTIPEKLIKKNLVQIGMLYSHDVSRSDRIRFLNAYKRANPRYSSANQWKQLSLAVYQRTLERLFPQ